MEMNLNIRNLGKVEHIFDFYKYITKTQAMKNHALLESIDENNQSMLFSFIGIQPDLMVKVTGEKLSIFDINSDRGEKIKQYCESYEPEPIDKKLPFEDDMPMNIPALDALKKMFPISKAAMPDLFPRRIFSGGLLGYVGYDVMAPYAGYKTSAASQEQFPDICMGLFTTILVYSHANKALYQIENNIDNIGSGISLEKIVNDYKTDHKPNGLTFDANQPVDLTQFQSNTTPEQWADMIDKTKEHLLAGNIIQAVLSRKMTRSSKLSSLDVYQILRKINPSPYLFHVNFSKAHNGDITLLGCSPEALITKDQTTLETVPIAGTRRRGKNAVDEEKMANELLTDEKERAEHVMLVDLARNDLAHVSMPGSVDTYELIKLRKYPNVMHLISKVRAISHLDPISILKSMFPAGTVSGAPKQRAMEIIHQLEREDRGPYAGTLGYISFTGNMDMAISIRTLFKKNNLYIAQAGAGIVMDSKPESEYLETNNKMKNMLRAINIAETVFK